MVNKTKLKDFFFFILIIIIAIFGPILIAEYINPLGIFILIIIALSLLISEILDKKENKRK